MRGRITTSAIATGLTLAIIVVVFPVTTAMAWRLDIILYPDVGVNQVWVQVTGPFGHQESNWFNNGLGATAHFNLTESDFPKGYQYKITMATTYPGSPTATSAIYWTEKSNGTDQEYTYTYSNGSNYLEFTPVVTQTFVPGD